MDRNATAAAKDNVTDVLCVFEAPIGADCVGLAFLLDIASTNTRVVLLQCLDYVVKREGKREELLRIRLDLILLLVAADRIDIGDTSDTLDLRPNDPVLYRA